MADGALQQIRVQDLPRLSLEQLRMVKSQVDSELELLTESLSSLKQAVKRFEVAKSAVDALSRQSQGQELLLPLTGSLYVPGRLASLEKLVVDIGAAYYVEKSPTEVKAYCDRRMAVLLENQEKTVGFFAQKEQVAEHVATAMQAKISSLLAGKQ